MAKDYSEYKPTDYEKYRAQRTNRKGVALDFFRNKVRCIRRSPAAAGAVVNGSSAVTAAAV